MSRSAYNMDMLSLCNEFDAVSAVKNFKSYQDYFDCLTEFTETMRNELRLYNPTVVIYDDTTRNEFLQKIAAMRSKFEPLEMHSALDEIKKLEEEIHSKHIKGLDDGIVRFQAVLGIISERITAARISVPEPACKPIILAVDDNPEILTSISGVLKDEYRVIATTNAAAAMQATMKYAPSLFLLDIEMPETNGYELAERIRRDAAFKNTPILFLTSKASRDHVVAAIAHGANDYILKPINKKLLLEKIQSHLI